MSAGQKTVPPPAERASKFYPTDDTPAPKTTRKAIRPTTLRPSLTPGTICIILSGRFRGKRVVLLRHCGQGVLIVTGPYKCNGVPLRRVNARYVIATKQKVDLSGLDQKVLDKVCQDGYFTKDKASQKKGEEAFFKQGDKPEPKKIASERVEDQKVVDRALLANIKKVPYLSQYLAASFSLRKGDFPHQMVF